MHLDHVDAVIEESTPRRMDLIGSVSMNCDTIKVFEQGTIDKLTVYFDGLGVRALNIHLSNSRSYDFGHAPADWLQEKSFDFSQGRQIIGVFGKVVFDPEEENSDQLLTLGFYRDECSATTELYYDEDGRRGRRGRRGRGDDDEERIAAIVIAALAVVLVIICVYVLLKNRGKYCKKRTNDRESGTVHDSTIEGSNVELPVNDLD